MIYGNAEHLGYGWDLILKCFKSSQQFKTFDNVKSCASAFIDFLNGDDIKSPEHESVNNLLLAVKLIESGLSSLKRKKKQNRKNEFEAYLESKIKEIKEHDDIFEEKVKLDKIIINSIHDIANDEADFYVSKKLAEKVFILTELSLNKKMSPVGGYTGVVFAGYGEKCLYPSLHAYVIDGTISGALRAWHLESAEYQAPERYSQIFAFAQADVANIFMRGIHVDCENVLFSQFERILAGRSAEFLKRAKFTEEEKVVEQKIQQRENEAIVSSLRSSFDAYIQNQFVSPIMKVVGALPKDEMAQMSEALVEITSLRRKIDSNLESVSGPVDVAVISKTEGFVWMKRKHYFDIELNKEYEVRLQEGVRRRLNDEK